MPRITYVPKRFGAESLAIIAHVNAIDAQYRAQGFDLTLRQVFYQFVSRGYLPNTDRSYKRLGDIVADARLAGLVDWEAITDRTCYMRSVSHWDEPADIMRSAADSFRLDKWASQPYRPEVWIEKDALVGVIGPICDSLDVPYFSCRGYTSVSSMWQAAQRLEKQTLQTAQRPVIFHLGDHDPSGIDMTRDIQHRMTTFGIAADVQRLALSMQQIRAYDPPPNPTKLSDSRSKGYIKAYGRSSWELDALEPTAIADLIRDAVRAIRDDAAWQAHCQTEEEGRSLLRLASTDWPHVRRTLHRRVKRPILTPHEAGALGGRGHKRRDSVPTFGRGNSVAYLRARLERDYPALHEQVVMGKMSAYHAAVEAGIRRTRGQPPDVEGDGHDGHGRSGMEGCS